MAAVEIERPSADAHDSTSFRLLPSTRAPRIRSVDPGEDLGTILRRTRRRRRISLAKAARDTRIAPRYITALEHGAPLDAFPAPVFARAFLREYARYLRIETEPLLQLLTPYEPPPMAPTLAVLSRAAPRPGVRGRVLALAGAAALSLILVVGSMDPLPPPASTGSVELPPIPALAAQPVAPASSDDVPRVPVGSSASTTLISTSGRSWLRIVVDGDVVFEGTASAGWSRSFDGATRIEMLVGNASAVDLTIGGRSYGVLGAAGEVRRVLIVAGPDGPEVKNLARSA